MGVSADTERLARAMFGPEQLPDVLEIISWYDDEQADDVHRAVLTLSKGDVDDLFGMVAAAVDDFRDVLMWVSQPEPAPEQRAAARERTLAVVRDYERARRQYLEGRYGVEAAGQIERSNRKLFGKPARQDRGSADAG